MSVVIDVAGYALPLEGRSDRPPGWWGMLAFITTEAMLFASLLIAYFYIRVRSPAWPLGGIRPPELTLASINTAVLLSSSAAMYYGETGLRKGQRGRLKLGLALALVLGAVFLGLQLLEYSHTEFTPRTNAYGSLFFTITGFHGIHVLIGLLMNAVVQLWIWLGYLDTPRALAVRNMALYWHFVDAVWIFVFASLYLSVRLF